MNRPFTLKHPLARLLVVVLLASVLLTACGPQATATPTGETSDMTEEPIRATATSAPEATPTPSRPVHLDVDRADLAGSVVRVVHPWAGEMADLLDSLATQFSLSNEWDIWVEMDPVGSESMVVDSLRADIVNQDLPGIVVVHPYLLDGLNGQFATVNLLDYYADPSWGLSAEEQADIREVFLSPYLSAGQLSALPVAPQATLFFYNQTWIQELGFAALPTNLTDLQKMFCDAAYANNRDEVDRNDGTGGWMVNLDPNVLLSWYSAFGGELDPVDLPEFNNAAGQEAYGFLEQLRAKGCAWESVNDYPYEYFANRLTILFAGETGQIPYLKNWMASSGSEDLWTVAPFRGTTESPVMVDGPVLQMVAGTPETQLASWLFMRYLLSPDVQAQLVRVGYSIPVRDSALTLLEDFAGQNPQWLLAYQFTSQAEAAPVSAEWGLKQWVLQDAIHRLLQLDVNDELKPADVLQEVDAVLKEMEGTTP